MPMSGKNFHFWVLGLLGILIGPLSAQPVQMKQLELTLDRDGEIRCPRPEVITVIPDRTINLLGRALAGEDPFLRQRAARDLGRTEKSAAAPALIAALKLPDPATRLAAAKALAHLPGDKGIPSLIEALNDDDPKVRAAGCRSLGVLRAKTALTGLTKKLADDDVRVASAGAEALGRIGDPAAGKALLSAAQSDEPDLIIAAMGALGRLKIKNAGPVLTQLAKHKLIRVRSAALEALTALGDSDGAGVLLSGLKAPHSAVRVRATRGLPHLLGQKAGPVLVDMLKDPDGNVRAAAARGIGQLPYRAGLVALRRLIVDSLPMACRAAEKAMGLIGGEETIALAAGMLDEDHPWFKMAGSRLLRKFRSNRNLERHIALLDDADAGVRFEAAYSLGFIGDPRAKENLRAFLSASFKAKGGGRFAGNAFSRAAFSLGRLKDEKAIPVLVNCINKSSGLAPGMSPIWALGKIGVRKYGKVNVTSNIVAWLSNNSLTMMPKHPECIKALGRLKDPIAIPILETKSDMYKQTGQVGWLVEWALSEITGEHLEFTLKPVAHRPKFVINHLEK